MPILEPLTANITIAIDALEQLHIDWHAIFKSIWEAAIKYACESKISRFAQTDEQIEYESHNMQQQLTRLANTNNGIMKFAQFISNMRITPSKEEQAVLINHADEIQIGGKTLLEWFDIYQTEAEKYNAPLRRARSIRSQDSNRSYVTEQIQRINQLQNPLSFFPFKSKIKQYEKINKVKIIQQTQIKDNKVKPLNKLQRPYFSPKLGSWEIDLVFGVNPVTRRRQHYLFAININTKYLVVIPLIVDEKNATPIDEVLHAPLIDQAVNPIPLVQSDQEKVEQRGRPKKYSSQEEAERIAAEQRSRAQQKYRIQRQEFRATANDLQLLLIRRLQKTIITNSIEADAIIDCQWQCLFYFCSLALQIMIQNEQNGRMVDMAGKKAVKFGPNALNALDALVHFTSILHDSRTQQSSQLMDSMHMDNSLHLSMIPSKNKFHQFALA
ncbi:MAG: hypothetical protein EZS28_023764 [Streblomastix strix]|uniref:Integrase catalytic domain-containing protein n=1 Tax=Streblomastix strix TaxID=222440 RepID=A0A5J4VDS5_9EUKA|nr:MAG: hypothetical protein EZS28_023764 [Streblomastix strix]